MKKPPVPWRTKSSKIVYQNKWMKIRHDEVIQPDGTHGTFGVVEKKPFAVIIPKIDGQFYFVEQYRYPVKQRSLEFPAGHLEEHKSMLACAKQELKEETGLTSEAITFLGELWVAPGHHTQCLSVFLAEHCKPGDQQLEATEFDMVVQVYSLEELKNLIQAGVIKDGPTVAAFPEFANEVHH